MANVSPWRHGSLFRLLEESNYQRDDKTAPGARRAVRPAPAHRCHVCWQQDQRHRAAGGWIWAPLGATSTASLHRARPGRSIHSISGASSSARPWPGALSQSLDQRSHSALPQFQARHSINEKDDRMDATSLPTASRGRRDRCLGMLRPARHTLGRRKRLEREGA